MRIRIPNTASRDILTGRLIFIIFEKQFVMYTIQYKGTFLYLHEEPSLVCRFAYILAYVYYIFFLVLVGQIASFAKTFLKAYFRLVGK
jgi:hypothetical protein